MSDAAKSWPDGRKFSLCLTHDVDVVDKRYMHCAYYFVKNRDLYQLKSLFTKNRELPFWNFDKIIDIESRFNVRSSFFFLNETKKASMLRPKKYALTYGNYNINDPRIMEIIRTLGANGWEIGVHGSYDSFCDKELLIREKKVLEGIVGKPILGIRQHCLNLDIPRTWQLQEEAGFKYDSSFGYRDRIGPRDGIDVPFYPLDDGILEIPLTIMDMPLFASNKDVNQAWEKCKSIIGAVEKRGALLTILWHNNRFNENEYPGQIKIYEQIIEECQRRGAWIATGEEIFNWWTR